MTDIPWSGIFPASLTMFDADGELDERATADHIDDLIQQGAHGIVVAGTSGEFIGLSNEERCRLFGLAAKVVAGRIPVIAGSGAYSTRTTLELTRAAADASADGAIVILPYYQRPARHEVIEHLAEIGAKSTIPVMAYNNPANSAAPALSSDDLATLYRSGAIRAVKSTFPVVHPVHEALAATDSGFRVFYGSFMAPLEALAAGAHGWISGILNVVTADAIALWKAVATGDLPRARAIWARILPIKQLYTEQPLGPVSDLAIYRAILDLRGRTGGRCRRPLLDLTAEQRERLADLVARPHDGHTVGTEPELVASPVTLGSIT